MMILVCDGLPEVFRSISWKRSKVNGYCRIFPVARKNTTGISPIGKKS
ncbi:MAG: hypothetical protein ACK456_09050 [Pseudanabaenaceae cyanobacterium]